MKKIIYAAAIMLPLSLFSSEARDQRWQARLEKFEKYRIEFSTSRGYSSSTSDLINGEIKSAEDFLSILKKYRTGDGSVKSENRRFAVSEIESRVTEISEPVISVYYAAEMFKNSDSPLVKASVKDEIIKYASGKGFAPLKKESRELDLLAEDYLIEKYCREVDSSRSRAASGILSLTEYELSRAGYVTNDEDLAETILASAEKICLAGLNREAAFSEGYLTSLPEWRKFEFSVTRNEKKTAAAISFAESHGTSLSPEERKKTLPYIENLIFFQESSAIRTMAGNTMKSEAAGYNNPVYEIPDFKKIIIAVDDIDKYRKGLTAVINGSEGTDFIKKTRNNNRGIAQKYISQYQNLFKKEKLRIKSLKEGGRGIIVYNEEMFNTAEKHFTGLKEKLIAYSDLSSDYIESIYLSWKIDPAEYLASYKIKTEKQIEYLSFLEKITADAVPLGSTANGKTDGLYRGTAKELFAHMRSLLTTESIPPDIRRTMNKEQVNAHSAINGSLRVKGSALASSARKNFESYSSAYTGALSAGKAKADSSELSIGQDEVDRLISCAVKYSGAVASMNYTARALKSYSDEYSEITDLINKGGDLTAYIDRINSGTLLPLVKDFSSESIDREMKEMELLSREGKEALSGGIALTQYYAKRGFRLKFTSTAEEINKIRKNIQTTPEVAVASWRMNGKNYRMIDANAAENLKKMINKKAWSGTSGPGFRSSAESFSSGDGLSFSIALPDGWTRTENRKGDDAAVAIELHSPDRNGRIFLQAVKFDSDDLQIFSDKWTKGSGFTPVSKNWGKLSGSDYLMTVAKNAHDRVMESYVIKKGGYVILLSGTSDKTRYANLDKNLKDIFSTLQI